MRSSVSKPNGKKSASVQQSNSKAASSQNHTPVQLQKQLLHPSLPLGDAHVAQLQQTIGNRAVMQLLSSRMKAKQPHSLSAAQTIQTKPAPARQSSNSSGVIQRYGDKVALEFKLTDEKLRELHLGLKDIYQTYKARNKEKRDTLDQQYIEGSDQLLLRQEYLSFALRAVLYKMANKKMLELDFKTDHAIGELAKIELSVKRKRELDKQALELGLNIFPTLKKKISEIALELAADNIYSKRQQEIEEWNTKQVGKKPRAKTPTQSYNDAKDQLKSEINSEAKAHAYHELADKLVQDYELGYMESSFRKAELFRMWRKYAEKSGFKLVFDDSKENITEIFVTKKKDRTGKTHHLCTLYENEQRFEKAESVKDEDNNDRDVYRHRESGEEYVQDAFDGYVKRYVSRALNEYDVDIGTGTAPQVHINADPRTKKGTNKKWGQVAQDMLDGGMDKEEVHQEIWKHQRQKEAQGGSPFISFTTTKRDIFGSTGMNFESEHGKATVDLAKIAKNRVVDTHAPEAFKAITGIQRPDPTMPFKENDPLVSSNSAARDAMRTRELVILGNKGIPFEAITEYSRKQEGKDGKETRTDYVKGHDSFLDPDFLYLKALAQSSKDWRSSDRSGTDDIEFTDKDWE